MARSRKSKTHNNRPVWASAASRNSCNHRRIGRRRSAWSLLPDARNADKSASIPAASGIFLHDLGKDNAAADFRKGDARPWKIAAAIGHTPVTCPAPNRAAKENGRLVAPGMLDSRGDSVQQQDRTCHRQRTADAHDGGPVASSLSVAALRAPLRNQRHLIFVRCRKHAGKTSSR
jgi:hypothetical protein